VGAEIAALAGFLGLSGVFALVGLALAGWMAWRIVEKAGLPGWTGLGAILLTLTAVGTIVPLILLWVFAFMRWPRDDGPLALPGVAAGTPAPGTPPAALPSPPVALADARGWRLSGTLPSGTPLSLVLAADGGSALLTGGTPRDGEVSVPDPSVGQPHARLLRAPGRLGLEDLGTPGGTWIDGARLLPEHGARDISAARSVRLGSVELALSRG
jgi:hypothetical protein